MERLLPFVPVSIGQQDIEVVLSRGVQVDMLRGMPNEERLEILDRLRAGVEPGRHSVEFREETRRAARVQVLVVDGKVI
jgi:hypothetical protein